MSTRIIVNNKNDSYGIVGDVTDMTYKNGEVIQVGDVVKIFNDKEEVDDNNFVVKDNTSYFVMGLKGFSFKLGKHKNWSVELIKKFYEVEDNEEFSILKMITRDIEETVSETKKLLSRIKGLFEIGKILEINICKKDSIESKIIRNAYQLIQNEQSMTVENISILSKDAMEASCHFNDKLIFEFLKDVIITTLAYVKARGEIEELYCEECGQNTPHRVNNKQCLICMHKNI